MQCLIGGSRVSYQDTIQNLRTQLPLTSLPTTTQFQLRREFMSRATDKFLRRALAELLGFSSDTPSMNLFHYSSATVSLSQFRESSCIKVLRPKIPMQPFHVLGFATVAPNAAWSSSTVLTIPMSSLLTSLTPLTANTDRLWSQNLIER